jgi:uncharacterized protein (TIGR02599 family)
MVSPSGPAFCLGNNAMPSLLSDRGRILSRRGFTILELLVASVVFIIIVGVVLNFTDQTSKIWRGATAKIQAFQEARAGFDAMTRNLAQAMLNTYYDYYDSANVPRASLTNQAALANFVPAKYDRMSDLHFVSGQAATLLAGSAPAVTTQTHAVFFQAPKGYTVAYEGLDNALNATGYFLQFDDGSAAVPDFISSSPEFKKRWRFRMMEMTQGTEELAIYDRSQGDNDWFVKTATASSPNTGAPNSRVIAENVIALILLPKLPDRQDASGVALAPSYNFNSRVPLGSANDPGWPGASPAFPGNTFTAAGPTGNSATMTRHHQLPPVMKAIMVVIDEASAARLQGDSTTIPSAIDFSGTGLFTDASKLDQDLQAVEDICNAKPGNLTGNTQKLNYRVFSTDIIMRQAKWSNK